MQEEEQSIEEKVLSCPFCHTRDKLYNYIRVGGGNLECKECHTIFDGGEVLFSDLYTMLEWVEHD